MKLCIARFSGLDVLIPCLLLASAVPYTASAADIVAVKTFADGMRCERAAVTSLDREAVAFVERELVGKYFSRGANSWFVRTNFQLNRSISELRAPIIFVARPAPISTADELNGVAWKGTVALLPRALRQWNFDNTAATETTAKPWQDVGQSPCMGMMSDWLDLQLSRSNGKWLFSTTTDQQIKMLHVPAVALDAARSTPYWSTAASAARPASADRLLGLWKAPGSAGDIRYEIKEIRKGVRAGKMNVGRCTGSLSFREFVGESAVFAEDFPSFFNCWTGSTVRLTPESSGQVRFERVDMNGKLISTGTLSDGNGSPSDQSVGAPAAATATAATSGESIRPSLLGKWSGKVTQSGTTYGVELQIDALKVGSAAGTSRYSAPLSCTGTLKVESISGNAYNLSETVPPSKFCASSFASIEPEANDTLVIKWYWPRPGGTPVASSTLRRIQ